MTQYQRVLFLGNSITHHKPKSEIGWTGDWGMAASAADKDYVHVFMEKLRQVCPDAQFLALNIADWERDFRLFDLSGVDEARSFGADLLILRVSENVDEEKARRERFDKYYGKLIEYVNPNGSAAVVCTGCFWDKPSVSRQIEKIAARRKYRYVNLGELGRDENNMAREQFWHAGVGSHPSDRGMAAIAGRLWDALAE